MFFCKSSKTKKAKYEATRFPSDWPSYLHNKCSVPTCYFPNSPQVAEGTFHCRAKSHGFYCEGTYIVTAAMANSALKVYMNNVRSQEDAERQERDAQAKRYRAMEYQIEEEARQRAAAQLAATREAERRARDAKGGRAPSDEQYKALARKDAVRLRRKEPVSSRQPQQPSIRPLPVPQYTSAPQYLPRPLPQVPSRYISEPQQQQPHSLHSAQYTRFESYQYPRPAPRQPQAPIVQYRNR